MSCSYCGWSTREIGIEFEKPVNISGQLAKARNKPVDPFLRRQQKELDGEKHDAPPTLDRERQFANLKAFYKSQLVQSPSPTTSFDLSSSFGYGSPDAISRLVGLYTGVGSVTSKALKEKKSLMREAYGVEEGIKVLGNEEEEVIERMKMVGWEGSMSFSFLHDGSSSLVGKTNADVTSATSLTQRSDINSEARFLTCV